MSHHTFFMEIPYKIIMKLKVKLLFVTTFICSISFSQITLDDLKIDTSITGFYLTSDTLNTQIFGKSSSSFSVNILPNASYMDMRDEIEHVVILLKQDSFKITDVHEKDTTLNDHKAYYLFYTDMGKKDDTYKDFVFLAFVVKEHTLIFFQSHDLDNGAFIEKLKKPFSISKYNGQ